jgi:hypothetical protein
MASVARAALALALLVCLASLATSAPAPTASFYETETGFAVPFRTRTAGTGSNDNDTPVLVVETASASSFRLGVRFGGWAPGPIESLMLYPGRKPAPFMRVQWGNLVGVQTSFGALLAATDMSGAWALYDAENNTLVSSGGAPFLNPGSQNVDVGVVLPVTGTSAAKGPGRACLGNGMFGPAFYYNRDAAYLSLAVAAWWFDPNNPHCLPTTFSGSVGAASDDVKSATNQDYCASSLRRNATVSRGGMGEGAGCICL